jgi:hypothetical protein
MISPCAHDLSDLPLFAVAPVRPLSRGDADFLAFHRENPAVYALLVRLAREWKRTTGNKLGIKALFERARWEFGVKTQGGGDFTLNNNYTPYYARLIMEREPDLNGLFQTREQKAKGVAR